MKVDHDGRPFVSVAVYHGLSRNPSSSRKSMNLCSENTPIEKVEYLDVSAEPPSRDVDDSRAAGSLIKL